MTERNRQNFNKIMKDLEKSQEFRQVMKNLAKS